MTLLLGLLFICGLHMVRGQGPPPSTGGGLVVGGFGDFGFDPSVGANPNDPSRSNFDANFNPGTDFSMVPETVNAVNTNPGINMGPNVGTNIKPDPNNPSSPNFGANFNRGMVPNTVNTNPGINVGTNVGTNIKPNVGVNDVGTNTVPDRDLAAFARRQNQGTTNNMAMTSNTVMGNMPIQPPPAPLTQNNIVGGAEVRKQQQFSSANQNTVLQGSRVDLMGQTGGGPGTVGTPVEIINNNRIDNAPNPNNANLNPRPIEFVNPPNTNAVNPPNTNMNNNAFQPGVSIQVAQGAGSNVVQTGQEFTQQQQTAMDTSNSANTINTNLNEAVGFGPVNEVPPNTPVLAAGKCETALTRPVYELVHGRKILNPQLFNLFGTKMTCPYGTGYSVSTCSCDLMSKEVMAELLRQLGYDHSSCRADVNINFDKGLLYDETLNHWSIESRGVTPKGGVAHFSGNPNTTFTVPKYLGYDLRLLAFEFKFKSDALIRDHPHPLITNCESRSIGYLPFILRNTEPTYGVILHSNSNFLTFFVKVERTIKRKRGPSRTKVQTRHLTLPVDPSKWNTVKYSFDGRRLRGQVNEIWDARPAKGLIYDRMLYPVSIGHCLRYGNFLGELDNIKIYSSCIPEKYIRGERYKRRRG